MFPQLLSFDVRRIAYAIRVSSTGAERRSSAQQRCVLTTQFSELSSAYGKKEPPAGQALTPCTSGPPKSGYGDGAAPPPSQNRLRASWSDVVALDGS